MVQAKIHGQSTNTQFAATFEEFIILGTAYCIFWEGP
jgi:hypothetical protein